MQQENRTFHAQSAGSRPRLDWRTPAIIVACGCLISMISFGPRSSLGFFLSPLSNAHGWGREVFAFSAAVQTLISGAAQPFAGGIADRFGTTRVIITCTLLYAFGLFMMAHAATPGMLYRMKRDTVRPLDRADAEWIRRTFQIAET